MHAVPLQAVAAVKDRKRLTEDIQRMQIAILKLREASNKKMGCEQLNARVEPAASSPHEQFTLEVPSWVELNPQLAEQQQLFPAYPWGYDQQPVVQFKVFFQG